MELLISTAFVLGGFVAFFATLPSHYSVGVHVSIISLQSTLWSRGGIMESFALVLPVVTEAKILDFSCGL